MKEELIKKIKERRNIDCYIFLTDEGMLAHARGEEILFMITSMIDKLKEDIPREEFEKCIEYAYMSDEEIEKEAKKKEKERIKEFIEMLKELSDGDNE